MYRQLFPRTRCAWIEDIYHRRELVKRKAFCKYDMSLLCTRAPAHAPVVVVVVDAVVVGGDGCPSKPKYQL